jgi:prephenate dehydrogenase
VAASARAGDVRLGRLLIIGTGLLGTSMALAARRAWPTAEIVGIDRRVRRVAPPPFDGVRAALPAGVPDLVVLACPVDAIVAWLPRLAARLPAGTPITDVGSTKRAVMRAARQAGLRGFVGGHPMAGGTRPGPRDARPHLFAGAPWLLVQGVRPAAARPAAAVTDALAAVLALVGACDGRPVLLPTAAAHDRLVAAISHLPQLTATALMIEAGEAAGDDALALAGPGLYDTTRLAASAASMWTGLLAGNADLIAPRLRALARRLDRLADALDDPRRVRETFARANHWRARLVRRAGHL